MTQEAQLEAIVAVLDILIERYNELMPCEPIDLRWQLNDEDFKAYTSI